MTKGRKALLAGAAIFLLAAVGIGLLVLLFPAERIGNMVVAEAEEALDREVRIESFRVRLLPRPAVALGGVEVSRHARPGTTDGSSAEGFEPLLASVDRIDLRPRILPLLRGNVIIEEVVIASPHLLLDIPEGGELDLPEFDGDAEPAERDAEIEIRSIVVQDGRVLYHDGNTGVRVVAEGIEHRLALDAQLTAGEMTHLGLRGSLSVAAVDAEFPEFLAAPLRGIRIQLDHDADLLPLDDRLDLRQLDLTVQEFPVEVTGTVNALSDPAARTLALHARGENIDVARFVASLPPEVLEEIPAGPGGETFTGTGGRVTLDVEAEGPAGNGAVPEVTGLFLMEDVALGYESGDGRGNLVDGLNGRVNFSLDGAVGDAVAGRLFGEPFELSFDVRDPAEPHGTVAFRGAVDLAEALRLVPAPEGVDASGLVRVDLTADGSVAEPAEALVTGTVDLAGLELVVPEIRQPVRLEDGRIELAGTGLSAAGLHATAGSSDFNLDVEVHEWLALALPEAPGPPRVTFDLTSDLVDANELLEADPTRPTYAQLALAHVGGQSIDGRSAAEHADEMGLQLPDFGEIGLDGRVRANRVRMGELEYQTVDARIAGSGGELGVPEATLTVMGGEVRMRAHLGRSVVRGGGDVALRPLEVEYSVTGVTADPFLEAYTLFTGHVGGNLLLAGSAHMDLHDNMLPEPDRTSGDGTIALLEGELRNWPAVQELGRQLGIRELVNTERLRFRDWSGGFQIVGSRVLIEESVLDHSDMIARLSGSFGITGDLDLGATLLLPAGWAEGIPGAPAAFLAALAADDEGRVPVGATLRGTTTSPEVSLDLSEAGARAADRAREAAEDALRDRSERLLDQLGIDRESGETDPDTADSVRDEVEGQVRDRLRRFLP